MRGKLMFLGGLAAGFVLGARAGRDKYDKIVLATRQVRDNPTVQEATGAVQEQASRLVAGSKDLITDRLGNCRFADTPFGKRVLGAMEHGNNAASHHKSAGQETSPAESLDEPQHRTEQAGVPEGTPPAEKSPEDEHGA